MKSRAFLGAVLFILLIILLATPARTQEPQPNREGAIVGRAVAADGQPLTNVSVMAINLGKMSMSFMSQPTTCDAEGNFKVTGLAHGVYGLLAMAPGYVSRANPSQKYRIGENVTLLLFRGGVITGRVTDEFGEPMVGAQVSAERIRNSEAASGNAAVSLNAMNWTRMTDDRGAYRIFGLEPGAYVVGLNASTPGNHVQGRREAPTYYPSSPRASAVEVNLQGSEEVSGIDIRARAARGRSISGTISGDTQGEGIYNGVAVMLYNAADKSLAGSAVVFNKQSFSLHGVDDGEYELSAILTNVGMDFSISMPRRITVKGVDISGIDLKLLKLGSISGRLVIETLEPTSQDSSKPEATCKSPGQYTVEEVLLQAQRNEPSSSLPSSSSLPLQSGVSLGIATPEKNGDFALKNLEAGRYWVNPELPDDSWYVRAIIQTTSASPKPVDIGRLGVTIKQGEKVSGAEIRVALGAASLSGKIVPAREGARLPKQLRVFLVPAETAAADDVLRYAETALQHDGSFEFKHLAPGKYLLHARQLTEKAVGDDPDRIVARDLAERAKLRREATAAKNEVELQPCQRVKDHALRW